MFLLAHSSVSCLFGTGLKVSVSFAVAEVAGRKGRPTEGTTESGWRQLLKGMTNN